MLIHVSPHGDDRADGSEEHPVATIGRGAELAQPGDTVIVREGVYREWVSPPRGGLSDNRRITYTAAPGDKVVIKGSEVVSSWEPAGDGVWRATVPNRLFGDLNPYREVLEGDWLLRPAAHEPGRHLGEVYLDGARLREVASAEDVRRPPAPGALVDDWTGIPQPRPILAPDLVWYAEVGDEQTTILARFGEVDPGDHLVEINVRRSVFSPVRNHIDYVTVRGFELAHAATPWAPPTADQPGLIGPNWAKGWIIEDNVIHGAKCSAVSLGKEVRTGHNFATTRKDKPGYQYQLESVFLAEDLGWSKERIGSHVVRRNTIYDCGQNAVVGHLGCAFSEITDNHIHDIGTRRELYGHEIAGIKLHAAIDVLIADNHIHDCSLGLWLDWQTQGTRVSRNVLHSNSRDVFIEVSHGPYVVDHNVFASPVSLENFSQGGAYVGNLFLGSVRLEPVLDRATPYHLPHSTKVAGYAVIVGGDDRVVGNVFADGSDREAYRVDLPPEAVTGYGTGVYDGHPASFDDYLAIVGSRSGDHRRFSGVQQAVTIRDNVYLGRAAPFEGEVEPLVLPEGSVEVRAEDGAVVLVGDLPPAFAGSAVAVVRGSDLGHVRLVGADFEDPDGADLVLDLDVTGRRKAAGERYPAGPLASLAPGRRSTTLWSGIGGRDATAAGAGRGTDRR